MPLATASWDVPPKSGSGYSVTCLFAGLRRAMASVAKEVSVAQIMPSGPRTRSRTSTFVVVRTNVLVTPAVVIRPTALSSGSVNQSPPGPLMIDDGPPVVPVSGSSVISPAVVARPIFLMLNSVNHSAPSDPAVTSTTLALVVGTGYSTAAPAGVTFAILFARFSVTQRLPSGPLVISWGPAAEVGSGYSVMGGGAAARAPVPHAARQARTSTSAIHRAWRPPGRRSERAVCIQSLLGQQNGKTKGSIETRRQLGAAKDRGKHRGQIWLNVHGEIECVGLALVTRALFYHSLSHLLGRHVAR